MAKTSTKAVLLSLILMTVAIISLPRLVKAESSSIHVTINKPQSGETCYIGDKVEIRVTPQIVVYGITNYVQVEVVKDNKILKHENLKSPTPTSSGGLTRPYKGDYLHAQRAGVASTVTGYRIMRSILLSWTLRTVPGYTS